MPQSTIGDPSAFTVCLLSALFSLGSFFFLMFLASSYSFSSIRNTVLKYLQELAKKKKKAHFYCEIELSPAHAT